MAIKVTRAKFKVGDQVLSDGVEYEIAAIFWNGLTWMCRLKDHPHSMTCGEEYLRNTTNQKGD